jgi:hypothetical protein
VSLVRVLPGLIGCAADWHACAQLIPWESLKDNEGEKNLTLALDVMEKHLGIERFCNAGDFKNLEDKATFLIGALPAVLFPSD